MDRSMQNHSNAQPRMGQGSIWAASGAQARARAAVRGAMAGVKKSQAPTAQSKQKSELSDVPVDTPLALRSKQADFDRSLEKENINTKNKSEIALGPDQAFASRQPRGHPPRPLRRSPTVLAHDHLPIATNMDAINLHGIAAGKVNSQFTEELNERRDDDLEMEAEEEAAFLEEQGETDSVSLICQERVDEAAEASRSERRGALAEAAAAQGERRRETSEAGKEEAEASGRGGARQEGAARILPGADEEPGSEEHVGDVVQAQEHAQQIESILKQAEQRADHVMRASPSKPKLPKSASTAPPIADTMQFIGLMSRHHNIQRKDKEQQQSQQGHGKRSSTALLRTPSQRQYKLCRNPVPAEPGIYQLAAQNMQPAIGDYNNEPLGNGAKIVSPDLPKVARRITMEPIKHDITTTSFSFRRQSPEHQPQGPSNAQMYRGTPQRTPQSRLRGFNQSASQRISLAQLSSSPVQPPFRKRYGLMQSKPAINNLKDPDDNQSHEPYGRLLSVNSGDSCNITPNKHHFDQFLGTKGRSKAAYEKSSFDSPERIDSGIKKKPSMKYTYLNQFSANRKIINSHQKAQTFMPQDMKTPIKEPHKSNVTPQKINDYQTLQHNEDMADENNIDDDRRFSSNTTKKFVTRMHGGSVIRSNFKVNPHSVQKNKIRSDSKSKSKQTSSSQRDMGICRQLHFDNEAPMPSPCFNSRDPTSKKFGALNRGGFSTGTANCLNMMTASDRWPGMQMQGMQHQPFFDEKFLQSMAPFQQGFLPGPQHQRQMLEAAQLGKMGSNRPTVNASLSPHNNISSIFGVPHAQQMPQYGGRLLNPFAGPTAPRHQSSRKKNRKGRKKQSQAGAGERNEGMDVDDSMVPFPYILQPIINIGGQMPSQLKKIYQVGTTLVSPERRKPGHSRPNDSTSLQLGKLLNDCEKPQPFRPDGSDAHMDDLGGETIGLKPRRRQRCNSSSETIKINGPNESSQKQRVTNNSVITASDRRHLESPGVASEESSSSEYSDDDDEDESSGSSPQYAHGFYKHVQLLQQQHEAGAQFFGDNRMRLRLDDGVLTAMPPQQQAHPLYYPQHLRPEHEHPMAPVLDQQQLHQTIFDCSGAASSPCKLKKGQGQHAEKCHNQGRHHHKVKMLCSCGLWQDEHHCSTSHKNESPVSGSTGKKPRQKSSLRKQRKREMKEKPGHASKYAQNHYFNARSPNALASYNPAAAGMMMPPYLGPESQYHHLQAINFMLQPSFLLGNINIVAGMNPHAHHHTGLNQLSHHQMANLAAYSPLAATTSPFHPLSATAPHSAATSHAAQLLLANQFPAGSSTPATADGQQQWTKKDRGGTTGAAATKTKEAKQSRKAARLGKKRDRMATAVGPEDDRNERLKAGKAEEEWSDGGVIEIRRAGEKGAGGEGKPLLELQRQLTFSNQKDVGLCEEEGEEQGGESSMEREDGFEGSGKAYKRVKGSETNRLDGSEAPESSVFKSPDQQQRAITRAVNEAIGLPSQRKRTKGKSKKRPDGGEAMTEQLVLQNLQSFNPNFIDGDGSQMQGSQHKQMSQTERCPPHSQHKKRSANKDDLIQITPEQKSKIDQGNRGHAALGQVYYAQTGQKKASHGGDGLNMMKQAQARMNGVHDKSHAGSSLMDKMFAFNNQMASADKIQVQKFNQNGLMDSLNPVMTAQRNDLEQIRILNPQKEAGMPQASDDHYTVSLSQMNGKKQPLTDQQPAYMNQSSFQNSTVKDYPISTGNNLEKTTIFNNSMLALHNPMMPAPTSSRQRQGSSTKKATNTNRYESAGGAVSNANAPSTNQGKRLTQQEKELQNHQNEENIRRKTEEIISQTITQQELFAKETVTQCKGCKCRNTRCLKLYCECLRNNATCGPACQCTRQGGECHNNAEHQMDRKKAVEEILKRNIDAFESKVDSHKKMHFKGCKCKASECQKKYCECFERGVPCTPLCKCSNCKNPFQTLAGPGPHEHDGESCPGHHLGEDLAVEDAEEAAASAILAADPPAMAQDLEEPEHEEETNPMDVHIINNNDESRETREINQEIESHEEVACIDNIEIKVQRNTDEQEQAPEHTCCAAKTNSKPGAPEKERNDLGSKMGCCKALQQEVRAQIEMQPSMMLAAPHTGEHLEITNPEEPQTAIKPTNLPESDQLSTKRVTEDQQLEQIVKIQAAAREQRRLADQADRYREENMENFNTMNIQPKAINFVQSEDGVQRLQLPSAASEMLLKKPTVIRKEQLQSQPLIIPEEQPQQSEWPKRDDVEVGDAQELAIKKQVSQNSLKPSKPASRSKRLAEKASKEGGKLLKQSKTKVRPSAQISALGNVGLDECSPLPLLPPVEEQTALKVQLLVPKKAQSSLSSTTLGQQLPQVQRRTKPPAPHEKMQTRHQKKLLQKQLIIEQKQPSSQEK